MKVHSVLKMRLLEMRRLVLELGVLMRRPLELAHLRGLRGLVELMRQCHMVN